MHSDSDHHRTSHADRPERDRARPPVLSVRGATPPCYAKHSILPSPASVTGASLPPPGDAGYRGRATAVAAGAVPSGRAVSSLLVHLVSPYQSFLRIGRAAGLWADEIVRQLDEFVAGTTWEDVCIQHLWRRLTVDQLSVRLTALGRWWDNKTETDLVGLWRGKVVLAGECKWTAAPVDERVLLALQQRRPTCRSRSRRCGYWRRAPASRLPCAAAPRWATSCCLRPLTYSSRECAS